MLGISTQFKRVIQNISGSGALDFANPSAFQTAGDVTGATKSRVLLDSRCFTETPIDAPKCVAVIAKVLYLIGQGEVFTDDEKLGIFFQSTRLFQSTSSHLRRMVHLLIKTLEPPPDVAFVVTSSLTKDMASSNDAFRANAFRTIFKVVDSQTAQQLERYLKGAIVSSNPLVSSTALICGIRLSRTVPEMVRRWVNEVSDCVQNRNAMVQFHALALLYELKKSDRLALHRIIGTLTAKINKSPIAECLLVRYATILLNQPGDSPLDASLLQFLDLSLAHRSEIVSFEAAKAFVSLALDSPKFSSLVESGELDLNSALAALQILLTNPKDVVRFAAIRVLYRVSRHSPQLVQPAIEDIEPLVTDTCRPVAVLALVTLLKCGEQSDLDKLLKQITSVMMDVSDSHRIEIVTALHHMCLTYPERMKTVITFLAAQMRDDGGKNAKAHTVDALCSLATENEAVHESVLLHLCDFIEDCEFHNICCHILSFLATEVPKTSEPTKYLRYIYNRVILENANVRAVAIDTLVRIGTQTLSVRDDVITLLDGPLLNDSEDELRDRVRLSLKCLRREDKGTDSSAASTVAPESYEDVFDSVLDVGDVEFDFSVDALVDKMVAHFHSGLETTEVNISELPDEQSYKQAIIEAAKQKQAEEGIVKVLPESQGSTLLHSNEQLDRSPSAGDRARELAPTGEELGKLHHNSKPQYITEKEAEYVVYVIKHFWENTKYVSMEVCVRNTLEDQLLDSIDLRLGLTRDSAFTVVAQTSIPSLAFNQEASMYILLQRSEQRGPVPDCVMHSQLVYTVKEEVKDYGFQDKYEMEPIHIAPGDYLTPTRKSFADFQKFWASVGDDHETGIKIQFGHLRSGTASAIDKLLNALNLFKCESPDGAPNSLQLIGKSVGSDDPVLIQARLVDSPHGVLGKIQIRCGDGELAMAISQTLKAL